MTAGSSGPDAIGQRLHDLVRRLYPICRSITGDGVRETLAILGEHVPMATHEVPSGTQVLDWTVPREWNVRSAWIQDPNGDVVVDMRDHNLHVMGYSVPIDARMSLAELRPHLHTLPDRPDLIPYRASFYADAWGFSMTQRQLDSLVDGEYHVHIDSSLEAGSLTYGEVILPGASEREVLFSSHVCHPSLCNDNLSGVVVATMLAKLLAARAERRYTYRFLFAPTTIGSITWLAEHESQVDRIHAGLVLTLLGDRGSFTYKRSRQGTAPIDRTVEHVLAARGAHAVVDFSPYGYDERQFCSPGFDLPVGCLMRTPFMQFPEYHTSGDDLAFVTPEQLADSYHACVEIVDILERDTSYVNLSPRGEPQLGRRGIYRALADQEEGGLEMPMLWMLNLSDGSHSVLDIARRAGLPFAQLAAAADVLVAHDLLAPAAG